jgi:hypothetical protein
MNGIIAPGLRATPRSEAAKSRLLAEAGGPLVFVEWHDVLFLHYAVAPSVVRALLPGPFELELHEGNAVVSLVALTKRHFRPNPRGPLWAKVFGLLPEERLFNLRTYVKYRGEPGAFFFWSWLSRPWGLPLPGRPFGLTCGFAESRYEYHRDTGALQVAVRGYGRNGVFASSASLDREAVLAPAPSGSLAEFALERYTGCFRHRAGAHIFRAWHPPWQQAPVQAEVAEAGLVGRAFPWFKDACLTGAHFAPGFDEVWIGRPRALAELRRVRRASHHGASAFFEMP